jgi:hypothetical protein
MTRRPGSISDEKLESALAEIGRNLELPPAPSLTRAVRARLEAGPSGFRLWRWRYLPQRRALAAVALSLAVLSAGILVFSPAARTAVASWLKGVRIIYREAPPTPTAGVLDLGQRVSLDEASREIEFRILKPTLPEFTTPDEIYLSRLIPGGQVAFVYYPRPDLPATAESKVGLLVTQFQGRLGRDIIQKVVGPETSVEPLSIGDRPGYWLEGRPHVFLYRDKSGQIREETIRLAGNTLLWEQDGLTLRIESALSKEQALRIAESVR